MMNQTIRSRDSTARCTTTEIWLGALVTRTDGGDARDGAVRALLKTRGRSEVTEKQLDHMIKEYTISCSKNSKS